MIQAFRILLNLYPGEGRKAQLFILLGLLWGIGSYGTLILSEGYFLEKLGSDSLPTSYLFIAVGLCLLSSILIKSLNHISIVRLFCTVIGGWCFVNLFFYLLYTLTDAANFSTFWFCFKVFGWMLPISIFITYWAFVDQYFDLQDGKRFFGIFSATLFLGDMLGSLIVTFGLKHFQFANTLLLFTFLLICSFPVIFFISRCSNQLTEDHIEGGHLGRKLSWKEGFNILTSSPFSLTLLLFYLIMQLIVVNTEFQYMNCFSHTFAERSEMELTEFFGKCNVWISFANMVLSLVLYSRAVQKIGVNNLIVVAPLCFIALFTTWIFAPFYLPFAVMGLSAREAVPYVLDDNNLNLLITAVPTKIRNRLRIVLESFFEPAGMLITSFLLMAFPSASFKIGLTISLAALLIALLLRHFYPKALFENLAAGSIGFRKKVSDWFPKSEKREVEFLLLAHLKKGDESSQLLALRYLLQFENPRLLIPLLHHIDLLSLRGKMEALDLFASSNFATHPKVLDKWLRWRRSIPYLPLRKSILTYYAKNGLIRPEKVVEDLSQSNLTTKKDALLAFKTSPISQQFPTFWKRSEEELYKLLNSEKDEEILVAIEVISYEKKEKNMEVLLTLLNHPSKSIVRAASSALARIASPDWKSFAAPIVKRVSQTTDPKVRYQLLLALEKLENPLNVYALLSTSLHFRPSEKHLVEKMVVGYGSTIVPTLLHFLENREKHERCRLLAGKILAKLNSGLLKRKLSSILSYEVKRASFYLNHAKNLPDSIRNQDLSVLKAALISGYHSVMDYMIQLIGAANYIEECEVLSSSLWSRNKKTEAQALEALENLTPPKLFQMLAPLLPYRKGKHGPQKIKEPLLSLEHLLDVMSASASPTDQIVAIGLKARLQIQDWRHVIRKKLPENEELIRHFAKELEEVTVN